MPKLEVILKNEAMFYLGFSDVSLSELLKQEHSIVLNTADGVFADSVGKGGGAVYRVYLY